MKLHYRTGILVPLFTLRTSAALGCGDFLSLIELGQWCVETGLDLIQLLPVNDTGTDPSPYSALSAYALHPLFIRISALSEYNSVDTATMDSILPLLGRVQDCEYEERLFYRNMLDLKISILKELFTQNLHIISKSPELLDWIEKNDWVREYAIFKTIKEKNEYRSWLEWKEYQDPSKEDIKFLWESEKYVKSNLFYTWIQFKLEQQFLVASKALRENGIILKGDIPILMNDDSVAVWKNRSMFHFDLRAGAPPDMFAQLGQNWGFPIYNWGNHEHQNYGWWRTRLGQAKKFYDAYRIDHVLGFFRMWTIPYCHREGVLGYFLPASNIQRSELLSIGLQDVQIYWLSEPHMTTGQLEETFADQMSNVISKCLRKLENEEMYVFNEKIRGERDIIAMFEGNDILEAVLDIYRDRALIQVSESTFAPSWNINACWRYQNLSELEKNRLKNLFDKKNQESKHIWKKMGENLLSVMRKEANMICCAEDLGVVPDCVPEVLKQLGIYGLKIPRWEMDGSSRQFTPLEDYPFNSVCAPSVHDTSTIREWWEYEEGREEFWHSLSFDSPCPKEYSTKTAEKVIAGILGVNSTILVFQIQDLFALEDKYRVVDSKMERMNIPGTVQDGNWSYRMPMSISDLRKNREFSMLIKHLHSKHRRKNTT